MGAVEDIVAQLVGQKEAPAAPQMGALANPYGDVGGAMPEAYADPNRGIGAGIAHALGSIATLPRRAIENSQTALDTGNYNPGPALEAAMLPMGTGAIAGVPVRAGEAVLGAGPIRAYHGSPHDFDAFSMDKIGSGEGAQAYGHGLYFAENEGVARSYRSINAPPGQGAGAAGLANDALKMANDTGLTGDAAKKFAMEYLTNQAPKVNALTPQHYYDAVNNFDALTTGEGAHGRMYEVNINADPEHFLDWDKPLAADHPIRQKIAESAQAALDNATTGANRNIAKDALLASQNENLTGQGAYHQLSRTNTRPGLFPEINIAQPAKASEVLRDAGIPGIKYLDQGSRAAGDGSRNYVLFNDKLVDIARKYGMGSIAAVPPAALAAMSGGSSDQSQ